MIWSVPIIDASAARACFARVARIDEQHRHSCTPRFIGDELAELAERPVVQPSSLSTSGLNPFADAGQVFQPNRAPGALRGIDEGLRNHVVDVGLEPPLLSRELAEPSFCGLCAAALKTSTAAREMCPDLLDGLASVMSAVAVGGDVDDAEIDAENVSGIYKIGIVDIADTGDVPLATHEHQIDLALAEGEQLALVLTRDVGNLLPSGYRPNRDRLVIDEAKDAVVIGLSREAPEGALRFPVELIGVRHLGDAAHGNLGRQVEHPARVAVRQLVQVELPEFLRLPRFGGEEVARLIATLKRLAEQFLLLWRGFQLDVGDQLHVIKYGNVRVLCQPQQRPHFLCQLKQTVSVRGTL